MSSDGMHVHLAVVDLEVQPVKDVPLRKAKHGLSEKRVQPIALVLVQDAHHAVANDQTHKRVHPLDLVLDVDRGVELVETIDAVRQWRVAGARPAIQTNIHPASANVDDKSGDDESEAGRVGDLGAADPESGTNHVV